MKPNLSPTTLLLQLCPDLHQNLESKHDPLTLPMYWESAPVYSSCRKNCFHIQPRLDRLSISVPFCFPASSSLIFLRTGPLDREIASTLRCMHAHRRTTIQVLIFSALRVSYKWWWSYLPKLQCSAAHPHSSFSSHTPYLKENWETITNWLKIPSAARNRLPPN